MRLLFRTTARHLRCTQKRQTELRGIRPLQCHHRLRLCRSFLPTPTMRRQRAPTARRALAAMQRCSAYAYCSCYWEVSHESMCLHALHICCSALARRRDSVLPRHGILPVRNRDRDCRVLYSHCCRWLCCVKAEQPKALRRAPYALHRHHHGVHRRMHQLSIVSATSGNLWVGLGYFQQLVRHRYVPSSEDIEGPRVLFAGRTRRAADQLHILAYGSM